MNLLGFNSRTSQGPYTSLGPGFVSLETVHLSSGQNLSPANLQYRWTPFRIIHRISSIPENFFNRFVDLDVVVYFDHKFFALYVKKLGGEMQVRNASSTIYGGNLFDTCPIPALYYKILWFVDGNYH